jgi:endonuclease/exonuclease/phosphatase family metal-dependent hydrolase
VLAVGCAIPQPHIRELTRTEHTQGCRATVTSSPAEDVSWSGPVDPRDRALLDAWCAAIGRPLVDLHAAGARSRAADRPVVVTWNVDVGAGDLVEFVGRLRRGDFTDRVPTDHFVMLLQEAYRKSGTIPPHVPAGARAPRRIPPPTDTIDIARAAASLGLDLFYAPAMRNGFEVEDRGNAILTTEAMRHLEVLELPFERQRRIALLATLEGRTSAGGPWSIRLVNVHLETRAGAMRHGPAAARLRQARALLERLHPVRVPTVVGGDFNTSWGDDEPAAHELRRALPSAGRTPGTTWSAGILSARLDHLFAWLPGERLRVRRIPRRFGSDHTPLLTVVTTSGAANAAAVSER